MKAPAATAADSIHKLVVGHPFCKGLNPHYVNLLTDCASLMRFGPGQDADRFYLIHKGRVALETFVPRAGATTIQTIEAGEALGWSWLYPPYRWQFTARADPTAASGRLRVWSLDIFGWMPQAEACGYCPTLVFRQLQETEEVQQDRGSGGWLATGRFVVRHTQ